MSVHYLSACWKLEGLTSTQKFVLISLADQANDDGVCWPSMSGIAKRTCLSDKAVRQAIKQLEANGVLSIERKKHDIRDQWVSNRYYLTPENFNQVPTDGEYLPTVSTNPDSVGTNPRLVGCLPTVGRVPTDVPINRNRTVNEPPKKQSTAFSVADVLLIFPGLNQQVAEDFIKHRKSKKAALTKTACEAIAREIQKSGWTPDEALRETMARGWQSFKADWVQSKAGQGDVIC